MTLSLPRRSRRNDLAASERSTCKRSRYSGVASSVTYSPEKHAVSHSAQLASYGLLALLLAGHDERAADVAILGEAFAVFQVELLRELQRTRAAGIRNGDDDVDIVIGPLAQYFLRQPVAHAHPRAIHGDV